MVFHIHLDHGVYKVPESDGQSTGALQKRTKSLDHEAQRFSSASALRTICGEPISDAKLLPMLTQTSIASVTN